MHMHNIATEVHICGVPCDVDTVTSATTLTCTTGQYNTVDKGLEYHQVIPIDSGRVVATGSDWEQSSYNVENLFDQNVTTSWRYAQTSC